MRILRLKTLHIFLTEEPSLFSSLQGVHLTHNASARIIRSNQSLVLQKVTRNSSGNYACSALNSEGKWMGWQQRKKNEKRTLLEEDGPALKNDCLGEPVPWQEQKKNSTRAATFQFSIFFFFSPLHELNASFFAFFFSFSPSLGETVSNQLSLRVKCKYFGESENFVVVDI